MERMHLLPLPLLWESLSSGVCMLPQERQEFIAFVIKTSRATETACMECQLQCHKYTPAITMQCQKQHIYIYITNIHSQPGRLDN